MTFTNLLKKWWKRWKNILKKEHVMTKNESGNFKNSTTFWICDNIYIDGDLKLRDHCHVTEKCGGAAHRDSNNNVELNNKVHIVFHNLKNYVSHLVMQDIGEFNLKINVIPNRLEKYITFSINYKLSFIDSFQFLIFSCGSFIKTLSWLILRSWMKNVIIKY